MNENEDVILEGRSDLKANVQSVEREVNHMMLDNKTEQK